MTRRMAWGLFVFFAKAFIWVALAHLAVDLAALATDLPSESQEIENDKTVAGVFIAALYGFLNGRQLRRG